MAAKMLDEVLLTEKQAAQNEQAANDEAQRIIAEAKEQAKDIEKQAQAEAQEYEAQQMKLAYERHENAVKAAENDAQAYAQVLKSKADTRFSEAVGTVRAIIVE